MGIASIQAYSLQQNYASWSIQAHGCSGGCTCHAAGNWSKVGGVPRSNGVPESGRGGEWRTGGLTGDRVTLSGWEGVERSDPVYVPAVADRYRMLLDRPYGEGRFEPVLHEARTWGVDDAGEREDSVDSEEEEGPGPLSENNAPASGEEELSAEDRRLIEELKQRDLEVRAHEQAHIAAGGQYVTGAVSYTYQYGPDGKPYAVGGEVSIDVSPVPGDPEKTEEKARVVRRAAMAPVNPSGQDMQVAARATQMEANARAEKLEEQRQSQDADYQIAIRAYRRWMAQENVFGTLYSDNH